MVLKELHDKLEQARQHVQEAKEAYMQAKDELFAAAKAWLVSEKKPLSSFTWTAKAYGDFMLLQTADPTPNEIQMLFPYTPVYHVYLTENISFNNTGIEIYLRVDFRSITVLDELKQVGISLQEIDLSALKREAKFGGKARNMLRLIKFALSLGEDNVKSGS